MSSKSRTIGPQPAAVEIIIVKDKLALCFGTLGPITSGMVDSVRNIVGLWPSAEALAVEIGAKVEAVRKWRQRNRIPAEWWNAIARSPVARAAGVTVERMAEMAEERAS
jgi:hypothetical protein